MIVLSKTIFSLFLEEEGAKDFNRVPTLKYGVYPASRNKVAFCTSPILFLVDNLFCRHPDKPFLEELSAYFAKTYTLKIGKRGDVADHIVVIHLDIVGG